MSRRRGSGNPNRHRRLVNTHHHCYQWMTRGWAFDCTLFGWLTTLYRWGRG